MTRLRLFLFYSLMAWSSAIRPADGAKMIDDAELGAAERQRRRLIADLHQNGAQPRELRTPSGSTLALAATVALLVTGGWLAVLVDAAIGWLQ